MKQYTVGFIFRNGLEEVLFLHPKRPDWQVGKLNGPGGRVEEGERVIDCMIREIEEETGLKTDEHDWSLIDMEKDGENEVYFYACEYKEEMGQVEQKTDEELEWLKVDPIPANAIENLKWLVPRGQELLRGDEVRRIYIVGDDKERSLYVERIKDALKLICIERGGVVAEKKYPYSKALIEKLADWYEHMPEGHSGKYDGLEIEEIGLSATSPFWSRGESTFTMKWKTDQNEWIFSGYEQVALSNIFRAEQIRNLSNKKHPL